MLLKRIRSARNSRTHHSTSYRHSNRSRRYCQASASYSSKTAENGICNGVALHFFIFLVIFFALFKLLFSFFLALFS
jgi:hypothetical protein